MSWSVHSKLVVRRAFAIIAMAVIFLAAAQAANAAAIIVNSLADGRVTGRCTLREAITAANTEAPVQGCTAGGSAANTIRFKVSGTLDLDATLPAITSDLTIVGPITIDGSSSLQIMEIDAGATVQLSLLTFTNGTAALGGAIANLGNLSVDSCNFVGNTTPDAGFDGGGAIASQGALQVSNSTFEHNFAESFGSAIYISSGTATISVSTFDSNGNSTGAGAIYNLGTLLLTDSTLSNNEAGSYGGGVFNGGTAQIERCLFLDNTAAVGGGGVLTSFSPSVTRSQTITTPITTDIIDSTFWGNQVTGSGGTGGAIDNSGVTNVSFSTVANNSAFPGNGGGIANQNDEQESQTTLRGVILASNSGGDCDQVNGSIVDDGYNIADDSTFAFSGTSRDGTDPLLSSAGPANNGGPTETVALQKTSPAIDAVPLAQCVDVEGNQVRVDQRGYVRPDPFDHPPACDIGAYESGALPPLLNALINALLNGFPRFSGAPVAGSPGGMNS
jgi:CSLREA domain-containing protein